MDPQTLFQSRISGHLTDSASFLHSRESAACASISRNPYFFLLASALLRSFASRIESETTRFNRNPYQQWCGQF
ncbi:hypothetical protein DVJ83_08875 [Deinococcus wulumuqiensis]|uniref:Uncharacterized protein n=1 Tax=Deinococcus wulumuqiensis TaxID=980427 RepID=A0A345IHS2_9DEIO|nr:hypothetical protein DVJ83_08875 [Deinococcus wulumuqiensis]